MDSREHWDQVYRSKGAGGVSWYQQTADLSLRMIAAASGIDSAIIDVGGGASTLVDGLLEAGYCDITVLDWSRAALDLAQQRLGVVSRRVKWREGSVMAAELSPSSYDVWHDRAVFHFLTTAHDRERYITQVKRAVTPGGHVLLRRSPQTDRSGAAGCQLRGIAPTRCTQSSVRISGLSRASDSSTSRRGVCLRPSRIVSAATARKAWLDA